MPRLSGELGTTDTRRRVKERGMLLRLSKPLNLKNSDKEKGERKGIRAGHRHHTTVQPAQLHRALLVPPSVMSPWAGAVLLRVSVPDPGQTSCVALGKIVVVFPYCCCSDGGENARPQ